jgi:hypothetical protein
MRAIASKVFDFKSLDARGAGQQGERRNGLPHHHHRGPHRLLHMHRKATVHQRELHTDAPSFALALRQLILVAMEVVRWLDMVARIGLVKRSPRLYRQPKKTVAPRDAKWG